MKDLVKVVVVFLSLKSAFSVITKAEETPLLVEDTRKQQIDDMIAKDFSLDEEENVFLKALMELPDMIAKKKDIEGIFGTDYSLIDQQAEAIRIYALNLTKDEITAYIDTKPYENPELNRIFGDFLELIDLRLDPNTLLINKDTYIFFYQMNEAHLTGVFTKLMGYYSKYTPLEIRIEKSKRKYISKVHELVRTKCPMYENAEVEHPDYHNVVDLTQTSTIGGGTGVPDEKKGRVDLAKLKNLYHVLNMKQGGEAQVLARKASVAIQALSLVLTFFAL